MSLELSNKIGGWKFWCLKKVWYLVQVELFYLVLTGLEMSLWTLQFCRVHWNS